MTQKRKSRSIKATPDGLKRLQIAKAMGEIDEGKPLSYDRIAELAKVSNKTVKRFFDGNKVDWDSALLIIHALNLQERDILPIEESLVAESIDRITGIKATPDGLKRLQTAKAMGEIDEGKPLSYDRIAELAKVSNKTVKRFFGGNKIDWDSALLIIHALNLQERDILPIEESLVAANPERASQLIRELETILREFKQDEETSLQAMDWLKASRKNLAQDAASAVLRKHATGNTELTNSDQSDLEQLAQDLRRYLQLLYHCLDLGTWELIDAAIQESAIPVNRDIELYVEALLFIKQERVEKQLPPEVTQSIAPYLDFLIKTIPLRL